MPFLEERSIFRTGRAQAVHEFAGSDRALVEDLGRKVRRLTVTGYWLGNDYAETRDRFVAACEAVPVGFPFSPSGTMIHPKYGQLRLHCENLAVTETRTDGGFASFTAEFVETEEFDGPVQTANAGAIADSAGAAALDASGPAIAGAMVTEGIGVTSGVRAATAAASAAVGSALGALRSIRGGVKEIEAFESNAVALINQAAALSTSPLDLVTGIRGAVDSIFGAVDNFRDGLFAYEEVLGLDLSGLLGGGTSTNGAAADANVQRVQQFTREAAAVGAVRSAVRIEWESLDEALERRSKLSAGIRAVLNGASHDAYGPLLALQARLVELVPPEDEDLPRLETLRLLRTEPSLVVAQRLYGDASRAPEIVARNRIRRPGFVPGGRALQVLSE